MNVPCKSVTGGAGVDGIFAAKIATVAESGPYPYEFLA